MEKVTNFTQFEKKITHISRCKLVYKYTITTITVHICMITIACVFNILIIFSLSCSLLSFSPNSLLVSALTHSPFSSFALTLTSLLFPHAFIVADQTMHSLPPIIKPSLSPLSLFLMPSLPPIKPYLHCRRSSNPHSFFPHLIKSFDKIENKSHSKRELNKKKRKQNSFSSHRRFDP